jgi:hypothetical protein
VLVQAGIIDAAVQLLVMSMNSMLQANYSSFKIHLYGGGGIVRLLKVQLEKDWLVAASRNQVINWLRITS